MSKREILLRLIRFTYPYKIEIALLVILGFISVGFTVLQPLPVKYIIDNVLSDKPLPQFLALSLTGTPSKLKLLVLLVATSVVIVCLSSLVSFASTHITAKVCQKLVFDFSSALFDKLQKLSLTFYSKNNIGDLMQRISADTYVIYSIVGGILLPTIISLTTLLAMFYVMYTINTTLALLAIAIVPVYVLLLYAFNKPMTTSTMHQYEVSGRLWSFIQQTLSSVKMIQAYNRENFTRENFRNQSLQYNEASVRSTRISMIYTVLIGLVSGIATAIIVGIGAYKGLMGQVTTGELFLFISYIGSLFGPVSSMAGIVGSAFTITARAARIFEVLDSPHEVYEKPGGIALPYGAANVVLHNVSFGYGVKGQDRPVLSDFNLEVSAGKMVAIIGPTGAGKTSLISLLLRFYEPWSGKIAIDGMDIKEVTLASLRQNISLVLQDSLIFPVSIEENIRFGNPNASKAEIIEVAKVAQAHEFISRLPQGYETIPSEGGVSLSGGERQRLNLARALLRKTPILILDEPTSALDVQTEAAIFKSLSTYAAGKTVFIISHRLSTIRQADQIISLKDGRIAEKGTHETLLKEGKVYAELSKLQYAG